MLDDGTLSKTLGNFEGKLETFINNQEQIQKSLEGIVRTCQSFEDYKENRKDLPERISKLEINQVTVLDFKVKQEEFNKKVDIKEEFILGRYNYAMAAFAVVDAILLILLTLYTTGNLHLGKI